MTATFLVTLNINSEMEIPSLADDIMDSLSSDGFDIIAAKPWSRENVDLDLQSQSLTAFAPPPQQPLF